ncbi:MAG: hypothetical protein JWO46_331 [Nocardioidaceae bacterium]|nr:hypothetical protein [Nocardioidaceae bacterium]
MSTTLIIVLVIVVVVVVGLLAVIAALVGRQRRTARHGHAEEIREQAHVEARGLDQDALRVQAAEADAAAARAEAERAELRAGEVRRGHEQERALHEDQIREADHVDPEVDTRADNYRPQTPLDPHGDGTAEQPLPRT